MTDGELPQPKLTKSRVGTWEDCRYKYKLNYIDNIQTETTSEALQRGIEIHEMLEEFYEGEVETINEATTRLAQHPHAEKYATDIKNFINFNKRLSPDGKTLMKPALIEERIFSEELHVSGYLDALWVDGDNEILLDYKTGKSKDIENYSFGMHLYTYLCRVDTDFDPTHIAIYFVKEDDLRVEEVSQKKIINAIRKIHKVREEINDAKEDDKFSKNPKYGCKWCDYHKTHCKGVGKWKVDELEK